MKRAKGKKENIKNGINRFYILMFWTRHGVHRAQAHTVCTTHIDKNRHRMFSNGVVGRTTGLQTLP